MKVKALRTKAASATVVQGVAAISIVPVEKFARFVVRQYDKNKVQLQSNYIKRHINDLSNQEKFDAVMARLDITWINDDVIDEALTVRYCYNKFADNAPTRFMKAYERLTNEFGVHPLPEHVIFYGECHRMLFGTPAPAEEVFVIKTV